MMDMLHDLLKSILPIIRINARIDKKRKIPHRFGGIKGPHINGHADFHRILPPILFLALPNIKGITQSPGQILVDGHAQRLGPLMNLFHRHGGGNNMQSGHRLPGHPRMIGPRFLSSFNMAEAGVFQVAVLHLFFPGRVGAIQHPLTGGDRAAQQLQITAGQSLEKNHGTGAVGQRVKQLHRDAAAIIADTEAVAVVFPLVNLFTRVFHILLHVRRMFIGIQIIPKGAAVQRKTEAGDAHNRILQSLLEDFRLNRFFQGDTDPKNRRPVPGHHRRINLGGVVQRHPSFSLGFHRLSPSTGIHSSSSISAKRYTCLPPCSTVSRNISSGRTQMPISP